ncbi:DUF5682 family protein [Inquilinus limosus]|uniref:4-aminobutyrate aminotransferase n=1 Tax=Inquilinus limosus TaxID=171674 RepID=A0A211ZH90_9PROT|nr:DUF5682 family protein [Inquilinus limosus]OWJ64638.1 hypothetical protein BWR60_23760 [Inquilinus limosus]
MTTTPVVFFPIRHHSPACALALARALDEIRPAQVLVEAPVDFEPLLPLLTDPAARPPIAIVSLPSAKAGDGAGHTATYPFCSHSPELVALAWARRSGAQASLIDLPARHLQMRRHATAGELAPAPLIADWRLDHNAYVAELCARRGVADALALWDALFEAQAGGGGDWRGFFDAVGLYCRHIRTVSDPAEMEADGTLAREAQMAARLAVARAAGPGAIAVVTGGFHTPALIESLDRPPRPGPDLEAPPANAFLVRYGFRQLDHFSGYGAGLPHPAYYDRLWHAVVSGHGPDLTLGLMTDFADHLRRTQPQLALATPVLGAAVMAARHLATLRDLPAPGRSELIDAIRSTGVKEAIELGRAPLLDAFHDFLTGDAMGELPPGTAQPPIVEAIRSQARSLGFNLEDGARRTRDLDILRKPRHAAASRFLFALDLVGAGFASRISGPDPLSGWRGDVLFESWSYAWSPMVEAALIGHAIDGRTLEALCLAELERRNGRLAADGRSRSAGAAAALLVAGVRTGFARTFARAADWCELAIQEDADAASIVQALSIMAGLARPGPGAPDPAPYFAGIRRRAFERLILLFPLLKDTPADGLPVLVRAVADLAGLVAGGDEAIDRDAFGGVLLEVLAASPPPALTGALLAFAGVIGLMPEEEVVSRIAAQLRGVHVEDGKAASVLTGCLAVAPRLIVHSAELLAATDDFFAQVGQDDFVAALPELRLAFGELTPGEIDRVASWAATRHGLAAEQLLDGTIPPEELAENMAVAIRMAEAWREDGLADWLEPRE